MSEQKSDIIQGSINLSYRWVVGPVGTKFFEGFKNKRIFGTKCPKCKRVLVPARKFCPRCFVDTPEWIEVSDRGVLRSFTIVNFAYEGQPNKPPYIVGIIDLEGTDVGFTHYVGGIDLRDVEKAGKNIRIGMPVKAVWRPKREGRITDIEFFKPVK